MAPTLTTTRLQLRNFAASDAEGIERLLGDYEVAKYTARVPHPYPQGAAAKWIEHQASEYADGRAINWAIMLRVQNQLVGSIGVCLASAQQRGELGYWIGRPYWGSGIATEAVGAIIRFAFTELPLRRITAEHLARNPASGRVLAKNGLQLEGVLREHFVRDGAVHDVHSYGLLRSEWEARP